MKDTEKLQNDLAMVESERGREKVETLYRFTDVCEVISYFGCGDGLKDRIESALQKPDIWQIFGMSNLVLSEVEIDQLKELVSDQSVDLVDELEDVASNWEEKVGGILKDHRPIMISPTSCGFAVNASATNYRTDFLVEVHIVDDITVDDLPAPQKVVLFEPTYVSTPPIFIEDIRYGDNSSKEEGQPFILEAYGRFLDQQGYDFIRALISEKLTVREAKSRIEKNIVIDPDTGAKNIFGIELGILMDYLYAEKTFSCDEERNYFFGGLEEELF